MAQDRPGDDLLGAAAGGKNLEHRDHLYQRERHLRRRQVAADGKVYDLDRIMYLRNYLTQLQRATSEGVPVRGYFLWSLMDNFEWIFGFEKRFGLYHVDFDTAAPDAEAQRVVLSRRHRAERDRRLSAIIRGGKVLRMRTCPEACPPVGRSPTPSGHGASAPLPTLQVCPQRQTQPSHSGTPRERMAGTVL